MLSIAAALIFPATAAAQATALYPNRGGTGTTSVPTFGQVLVGQTNGTYGPQATSSLKINTSDLIEGSKLFYTDSRVGSYITGSTTIRDYLNWWYKNDSGNVSIDRKVGIGVSDPAADLVINGITNTQILNVASTTATSTFNGNVKIEGNLELSGLAFFTVVSSGNMSVAGNLSVTGTTEARGKVYSSTGALTIDQNGQSNGAIVLNPTSGNIGIGDANPSSKLSVTGNSVLTGNLTVTGSSNLAAISGTTFTGTGVIATNSTTTNATSTTLNVSSRATFPGSGVWTSSGNVGIGTTTPATKLSVFGTTTTAGLTITDPANQGRTPWNFRVATDTLNTNVAALYVDPGAGGGARTFLGGLLNFSRASGIEAFPSFQTTDLMTWGANGSVSENIGYTGGNVIYNSSNGGGAGDQIWYATSTIFAGYATNNERMRLKGNSGNLGIGTNSPTASLSVVSTGASLFTATSSGILRTTLASGGVQTWYLSNGGSEIGSIAYSTPDNNPGIIFNTGASYSQNRFNMINEQGYFNLGFDADGRGTGGLNIKAGGNVG
ncbi:MAG: hypothetical protein WC763_04810, partial [Candidatus Paceibacterota bacterium]